MNAGDKIPSLIDGLLVEHTVTEEEARLWQAAQTEQPVPTLDQRVSDIESAIEKGMSL